MFFRMKKRVIAFVCVAAVAAGMFSSGSSLAIPNSSMTLKVASAADEDAFHKLVDYQLNRAKEDPEAFTAAGNVWNIIALARSGSMTQEIRSKFIENMRETVKTGNGTVDNKTMLVLAALGADLKNFEGYNLLEALADYDTVISYGLTNAAYALIVLDTRKYEVPDVYSTDKVLTSREKLIQYLLENELADGGWSWGTAPDPDTTGIVLQALAAYTGENEKVAASVNKALAVLSGLQQESGGYKNADSEWGGVQYPGELNCESTAQVWCALTALHVELQDERFVKGGNSVEDALLRFQLADGSFTHVLNEDGSGETDYSFATPQAFCALVSYDRLKNGKTALYDMTDTVIDVPSKTGEENPVTPTPDVPKVTVQKQKITSLKSLKKRQVTVQYVKMEDADGYEVQYSAVKTFAKQKTTTVMTKKTTYTIKKLKSKSNCFVRVRAYRKADGRTYYGSYSKIRKVKVK